MENKTKYTTRDRGLSKDIEWWRLRFKETRNGKTSVSGRLLGFMFVKPIKPIKPFNLGD